MPKHNYSQYSNKKNNPSVKPINPFIPVDEENEVAVEEVKPMVKPMVETVETVTLPKTVKGVVVNCAKLNVRMEPNATADVVCILDAKTEIEIDVAKSNDDWIHVYTATGAEGYCMRKFVNTRL